jgi:hypothetical protein
MLCKAGASVVDGGFRAVNNDSLIAADAGVLFMFRIAFLPLC